ncbi:hypothetical protein PR048_006702 [Dryococelus australis]|uniref:Uncharacterized protein n=1 Tax=Dryococelus australis TaxID=614101 RepID=A0ABQ9IBN8_9NEOP|nr:hypothetical protein PR048_006702 [Dryococelus australis]
MTGQPDAQKQCFRVVTKVETEDQWESGLVVRKCRKPRSYWILRDRDKREVRQNTYHMRHTKTNKRGQKVSIRIPDQDTRDRALPKVVIEGNKLRWGREEIIVPDRDAHQDRERVLDKESTEGKTLGEN